MTAMPLEDRAEWTEDALDVITHLAQAGESFTADALHDRLRPPPSAALVGTVFRIAVRRGVITCTGHTESTHPTRRGGIVRVWVGSPQHSIAKAA